MRSMTLVFSDLDCSQSPIFPWDFRDSYASIEAYESRKSHGKIGDCEQPILDLAHCNASQF